MTGLCRIRVRAGQPARPVTDDGTRIASRSGEGERVTSTRPERLPTSLGPLRVLADGRSSALLRRDGEVVWFCLPGLDGDPVLWSLLDSAGPAARWQGLRAAEAEDTPAAPALRTVLQGERGRVECLDGLLADDGSPPVLVRLVRALDDELDVEHVLDPGRGGWDGGPVARLSVRADTEPLVPPHDGPQVFRLRAPRGTWRSLVIGLDPLPDDEADRLHARLLDARATADRAVAAASLPRPHPERSADALRVLQACTVTGTGAVAAALTTSLPEAVPGNRNWDYRYCWLRDASLAVSVASLVGAHGNADRFLRLVEQLLGDDPLSAAPVFALDGGQVPEEREVTGVDGWAGVRPVHAGNGARDQVQHDALGLYVEAVSVHVQTGGGLADSTWQLVQQIADGLADHVLRDDLAPSSGIWELPEPRQLVSEDIGRWLALDRAVWIARGWRPLTRRRRRWKKAAEVLERRVLSALRPDGTLPLDYDEPDGPTDASSLFVALFGMRRGEQARRLVLGTLDRLAAGPSVYRYDPATSDGDELSWDGLRGREGTFLPISFMAVGALAAVGLLDQAEQRLDDLCAQLPRLLPEMWDPAEARPLGNVPLAWSHMELVRAAYVLDALRRRERLGAVGFTLWRVGRYLALRRRRSADAAGG